MTSKPPGNIISIFIFLKFPNWNKAILMRRCVQSKSKYIYKRTKAKTKKEKYFYGNRVWFRSGEQKFNILGHTRYTNIYSGTMYTLDAFIFYKMRGLLYSLTLSHYFFFFLFLLLSNYRVIKTDSNVRFNQSNAVMIWHATHSYWHWHSFIRYMRYHIRNTHILD